ncbi:c-type cytochrome [uncultured Alsobacter sp.]|uniref:c-type cytochrome n=1 Tax=uncultured Alsobacter sp. TaxID=1748258 RepID=UPI0025D86647|nr:c-type cytochrome [uncultured Alsobacter sp.]
MPGTTSIAPGRAAPIALVLLLLALAGAGGWAWRAWAARLQERDRVMALTGGNPDRAQVVLHAFGCAACHAIAGVPGAEGRQGPLLERVARRSWVGGVLPNSPDSLVRFIVDPPRFVPGSAMPRTGIDEAQARDVAAFLLLH